MSLCGYKKRKFRHNLKIQSECDDHCVSFALSKENHNNPNNKKVITELYTKIRIFYHKTKRLF